MKIEIVKILKSVFGACLSATGINLFVVSSGMYNGGIMGIGQIIRTILVEYVGMNFGNIDISGIIVYILNIPLFALAYFKIGKKFFTRTIISVSCQTLFLTFLPTNLNIMGEDKLAAMIIGGIMSGCGVGICLSQGSSGGGQDIIGVYMMQKSNNFSVGKIAIIINTVVFTCCLLMYDLQTVIYSLIYVSISSSVVDRIHLQNVNVKACIITDKHEEIREIIENMGRSTTIYDAHGGYSGKQYKVVNALLSRYEKRLLMHELDKRELTVFADFTYINEVIGNFPKHLYNK